MDYKPQTDSKDYFTTAYVNSERFASFAHQAGSVMGLGPKSVLEVGIGNGITRDILKKFVEKLVTLDIDQSLNPDFVGSITETPFPDKSFDLVLAAEILEHISLEDLPKALSEIRRISKKYAVITVPHSGYVFSLEFKIPLFKRKSFVWKLPHFWKKHYFNGQHYWELGKSGYSRRWFISILEENGFRIISSSIYPDDPAHFVLVLSTDSPSA